MAKFGIPATNLATKGDSITFSTPTIEGTIMRRNKLDAKGKHPWKAYVLGQGGVLRTAVIFFYLSNEGVSILENSANLGLPIPETLKEVLEQLHDRGGDDNEPA